MQPTKYCGGKSGNALEPDRCKFWSELIAKAQGGGGVQALCLNPASPKHGEYTFGRQGCDVGEAGEPIDLPRRVP
jgi:hypothetical protein